MANFRVDAPAGEMERVQMNEAELIRAATTSAGKFYTPETTATLLKDLPKPQKVPLDTDPPDSALEHLADPAAVPHGDRCGMGFEETQADGIIVVRIIKVWPCSGREADVDTSLESRIATLRAQVRRVLALHGMSWVVGLVVPIIIVVGLLDWMVHLDALVRLAALLGLIGFAGWLGVRKVIAPLVVQLSRP